MEAMVDACINSDEYLDWCKYHGKSKFHDGKCLKCKSLLKPIYRINVREHSCKSDYGFYRIGKRFAQLDHPLYALFHSLKNRDISYAKGTFLDSLDYLRVPGYMNDRNIAPGCYGIFKKSNKSKGYMLGECLYIGQSVNIKSRFMQHRNLIGIASGEITKAYGDISSGKKFIDYTKLDSYGIIPTMYYELAKIGLENLYFVKLYSIGYAMWNRMYRYKTNSEALREVYEWNDLNIRLNISPMQFESLAILEQYFIDSFNPRLNVISARRSDIN